MADSNARIRTGRKTLGCTVLSRPGRAAPRAWGMGSPLSANVCSLQTVLDGGVGGMFACFRSFGRAAIIFLVPVEGSFVLQQIEPVPRAFLSRLRPPPLRSASGVIRPDGPRSGVA